MPNTAIKIEHVSKMYRLWVINNGTLFKDIQTLIALKRGKEDPHSRIGENKYSGDKDHFWALKDVSFDIKQGDRLGIIGKNGAGKSTLLKILSRITAPTEGIVKIRGKIASLLEVGTGFHGELTGRENIYLNGAILGMKKRRIDEKMDSIIEFSGIEHHIDTPVKRYSSGMYVRLAFAVAAHLDSDILIADEVLAVGDAEFQKKALGKMEDLSTSEGRTVLFVSHNMGAVRHICNKAFLLENGRLSLIGETQHIIDKYLSIGSEITKRKEEWITSTDNRLRLRTPYFVNEINQTQEIFSQGEGVKVIFEIEFIDEFKKIMVGVALNDMQDNRVLTSHSMDDENFEPPYPLKGKVKFECHLATELLAPRDYQLVFGIRDEANNNILLSKQPLPISFDPIRSIDGDAGFIINAGYWRMNMEQ
jgi:lipopolysaccharide transport system ATP-binding protein